MDIKIADGSIQTVEIGDTIKLKDGREMQLAEFANFGKLKLINADGQVYFASPSNILKIIQKVVETVEEVAQTVEKAETFLHWFKKTGLGVLITSFFQKK